MRAMVKRMGLVGLVLGGALGAIGCSPVGQTKIDDIKIELFSGNTRLSPKTNLEVEQYYGMRATVYSRRGRVFEDPPKEDLVLRPLSGGIKLDYVFDSNQGYRFRAFLQDPVQVRNHDISFVARIKGNPYAKTYWFPIRWPTLMMHDMTAASGQPGIPGEAGPAGQNQSEQYLSEDGRDGTGGTHGTHGTNGPSIQVYATYIREKHATTGQMVRGILYKVQTARDTTYHYARHGTIKLFANGGDGGPGGPGGAGGKGGDATPENPELPDLFDGGFGGHGGRGGDGGNGGDGGHIKFYYYGLVNSHFVLSAKGGRAGTAGPGGKGALGGKGSVPSIDGAPGLPGKPGIPGHTGRNGVVKQIPMTQDEIIKEFTFLKIDKQAFVKE